jgi:DNA gyrase subunit A
VNKAAMVERIGELAARRRSTASPTCATNPTATASAWCRAEARCDGGVVLNQLYRFTPLQTIFGANMVALDGGRRR